MLEFFKKLFDTSDYPARWNCGNWSQFEGWLHICSDITIFVSYFAIPVGLLFILYRMSTNLKKIRTFLVLFSLFIFLCGFTHLIEAYIFYNPIYRISGMMKFLTAFVSVITAVYLLIFVQTKALKFIASAGELDVEKDRFERAFYASGIGMGLVSAGGEWLKVNPAICEMLQYTEEELLSMTFMDHTLEDDIKPDWDQFEQVLAGTLDTYQMRKRYIKKDGTVFPVRLTVSGVRDENGNFMHTVSQIEDITEIEASERHLKRVESLVKDLEGFIRLSSHDLKSPLRAISNLANWLEEDIDPKHLTEEALTHLKAIKKKSTKMHGLIDAILEYTKIPNSDFRSEVDVSEVVQNCVDVNSIEKDIELNAVNLPVINANRHHMQMLFNVFIENAIEHSNESVVEIDVIYDNGKFIIKDDGPGIEPRYHDKIFQMFEVLNPNGKIGAGLAIAKRIVHEYDGEIGVESNIGEGSKFWFTLSGVEE